MRSYVAALLTIGVMFSSQRLYAAQQPGPKGDVDCVLVGARLASSLDASERLRGGMLMMYYLGRLDGRYPGLDLERLLADESSKLSATELQMVASRCGSAFAAKGQEISRIGNSLSHTGK